MHDVRVRLIGNAAAWFTAPLGPTHEASNIAILRAVPQYGDCRATADAEEMKRLDAANRRIFPARFTSGWAKEGDPIVTDRSRARSKIAKIFPMRDGADALIVTTGVTLKTALNAADLLASAKYRSHGCARSTVKPLDKDGCWAYCQKDAGDRVRGRAYCDGPGWAARWRKLIAEAGFTASKRFRPHRDSRHVFPIITGSQAA